MGAGYQARLDNMVPGGPTITVPGTSMDCFLRFPGSAHGDRGETARAVGGAVTFTNTQMVAHQEGSGDTLDVFELLSRQTTQLVSEFDRSGIHLDSGAPIPMSQGRAHFH